MCARKPRNPRAPWRDSGGFRGADDRIRNGDPHLGVERSTTRSVWQSACWWPAGTAHWRPRAGSRPQPRSAFRTGPAGGNPEHPVGADIGLRWCVRAGDYGRSISSGLLPRVAQRASAVPVSVSPSSQPPTVRTVIPNSVAAVRSGGFSSTSARHTSAESRNAAARASRERRLSRAPE